MPRATRPRPLGRMERETEQPARRKWGCYRGGGGGRNYRGSIFAQEDEDRAQEAVLSIGTELSPKGTSSSPRVFPERSTKKRTLRSSYEKDEDYQEPEPTPKKRTTKAVRRPTPSRDANISPSGGKDNHQHARNDPDNTLEDRSEAPDLPCHDLHPDSIAPSKLVMKGERNGDGRQAVGTDGETVEQEIEDEDEVMVVGDPPTKSQSDRTVGEPAPTPPADSSEIRSSTRDMAISSSPGARSPSAISRHTTPASQPPSQEGPIHSTRASSSAPVHGFMHPSASECLSNHPEEADGNTAETSTALADIATTFKETPQPPLPSPSLRLSEANATVNPTTPSLNSSVAESTSRPTEPTIVQEGLSERMEIDVPTTEQGHLPVTPSGDPSETPKESFTSSLGSLSELSSRRSFSPPPPSPMRGVKEEKRKCPEDQLPDLDERGFKKRLITMANDDDESYQTVTQHIPPSPKPGYVWEVQETKCTAVRYKVLDKLCFRCRARKGILTCVFQNLRAFLVNEKTRSIDAKTAPVFISNTRSARAIAYPPTSRLNGSLDRKARSKIQAAVSPYLIRQLESELAHAQHPDCILQYLSNDSRITCEHCQTTIFAGYWMCHKCGRDMCLNCYPDMDQANARPPVDGIEMHRSAYHRLLSCAGRPRADTGRSGSHAQDDFSPATTIHPDDLARLLADLRAFKAESFPEPEHPAPNLSSDQPDSLPYPYLAFEELSEQRFHHLWARGEPLVVHGVLRRMELKWTPEYFAENFGDRKCTVVDTKSAEGQAVESTVGNFFRQLGKARVDGNPCWKLKDWPPTSDFRETFPQLYDDFVRALPVPSITAREGVLNLSAHFPDECNPPDLGPKMYNAMGTSTKQGSHGTTRLHMDHADAVNMMCWAAKTNGQDGTAAWDIFRAEDTGKLREYLYHYEHRQRGQVLPAKQQVPLDELKTVTCDPIVSQEFYIDESMRKELFEQQGVKSFRIYQKAGEAVFIPAGCAHQVANLSDSIKIAVDFMSIENINRCMRVAATIADQPNRMEARKVHDLLQPTTVLLHAWRSCARDPSDPSLVAASPSRPQDIRPVRPLEGRKKPAAKPKKPLPATASPRKQSYAPPDPEIAVQPRALLATMQPFTPSAVIDIPDWPSAYTLYGTAYY